MSTSKPKSDQQKKKDFLFTFSPIGLGDPYIRNICSKVVRAKDVREAYRKFILSDDGNLLSLFYRFKYNYGDDKTQNFPQGETKHYCDQLINFKLLPENKDDWDEDHCIIKEECEDEEQFMVPYRQFLNSNIETLIDYFLEWDQDGREIRSNEIKRGKYLW